MIERNKKDKQNVTVVIVDDEEIVTRSIVNLLTLETDYRPLAFQSAKEALHAMRREVVDCVVTDFLMPEMDGVSFLKEVDTFAPDVPKIILTGYADKENAIRAINEVNIFQYLEKPWDNDNLKLIIRNAVNHQSMQETLAARLHELDRTISDRDNFRRAAEQLEAELALAQEVQQSILPRGPLDDEHFKFFHRDYPTGRLGGDFFDIAFTGPGCFNAIVADVAGHGAAAALGTMLVKVIFRETSARGECCDNMLADMNGRLGQYLTTRQFVTAFVMSVNGPEREVTAASAGGPHPIIFSRNNDRPIEQWILNGMPLGAFDDRLYRAPDCQIRKLAGGERMLLYTDGLLDVDVADGEPVAPAEIVRIVENLRGLEGEELLRRLAETRGIGKKALPDDVNILLIDYD